MPLENIAPHGPFTIEVRMSFTNGEQEAEASFDAPVGHIPQHEDLVALARNGLETVREQLGPTWRLMNRAEFVQAQLSAQSGANIRFAVPAGEFDKEWPA